VSRIAATRRFRLESALNRVCLIEGEPGATGAGPKRIAESPQPGDSAGEKLNFFQEVQLFAEGQ
jgi:hypothetical protein